MGTGTELTGKRLKHVKDMAKIGELTKNHITQKYNNTCMHMNVALFMVNPSEKVKGAGRAKSGKMRGVAGALVGEDGARFDTSASLEELRILIECSRTKIYFD